MFSCSAAAVFFIVCKILIWPLRNLDSNFWILLRFAAEAVCRRCALSVRPPCPVLSAAFSVPFPLSGTRDEGSRLWQQQSRAEGCQRKGKNGPTHNGGCAARERSSVSFAVHPLRSAAVTATSRAPAALRGTAVLCGSTAGSVLRSAREGKGRDIGSDAGLDQTDAASLPLDWRRKREDACHSAGIGVPGPSAKGDCRSTCVAVCLSCLLLPFQHVP
jgi:hypothetical protein